MQPAPPTAAHQQRPDDAPLVLSVLIEARDGHQILTVTGDLVGGTTELLRTQLTEARSTAGEHLLVDLTGIRSVDASGLAVLVDAHHRSNPQTGCLHIVAGDPTIRLDTATGLWRTLRPHPTQTSAVAGCPHSHSDQTEH